MHFPYSLPIASEMRDTRSYYKATILCQTVVTWLFLAIGIIVYCTSSDCTAPQ